MSSLYVPVAKAHIHKDTGTYRQTHRCKHRHTRMHVCMHAPINKHKQTHSQAHTVCTNNQAHTDIQRCIHTQTHKPTYPCTQCMHAHVKHTQTHAGSLSDTLESTRLWPLTIFPRSFPAEHVIPKLSTRGCSGASAELTESRTYRLGGPSFHN